MTRKYEQKRRSRNQDETRRRIVDAAIDLHESVGVANATISAIAERAGVQRATVYRHFPTERSLFSACTGHYLAENPPPDPEPLQRITEPLKRLEVGLASIYAYHRRTEEMTHKAQRDLPQFPELADVLTPYVEHWSRLREILSTGWEVRQEDSELLRAAIGHAMSFQTWRSLAREEQLDDTEIDRLMVRLVHCIVHEADLDSKSDRGR